MLFSKRYINGQVVCFSKRFINGELYDLVNGI